MKSPFSPRQAFAVALMSLAGMLATSAFADQTFNISIPQRGLGVPPPPEAGFVRLRVDGTGVGNSAATVNGTAFAGATTTCDANPATCNGTADFNQGGATPNNLATVKRVNANRIDFAFNLKKDFVGEDMCGGTFAPGVPTARTITINLPGVSAATTYRMATYTVPERTSAKCDVAFRRVDLNHATAAVSGAASTNAGRLPLDIVLVLDKSGSMGLDFSGGFGTPKRIDRLHTSVGLFVDLWQSTDASVEGSPEDRMGLVSFDSTAAAIPLDGANLFVARGNSTNSWDIVKTKTNELTAGSNTSIGGGIKTSYDSLATITSGANDPTVILFTDGEQNTPPMLSMDRPTKLCPTNNPCLAASADPADFRIIDKVTPVLSVGLGGSSSFYQLLDNIALETAGRTRLVKDTTLMDMAFVNNLVSALKGNTLSINAQTAGSLAAADVASPPLTASIDGSVRRVSFAMSWDGGNGESVELAVTGPGNTNLNPTLIKRNAFYRVLTYDVTGPAEIGDWTARVIRFGHSEVQPVIKYQISVVPVEGKLSYRFYDSARLGTGVPVTMHAELGWEGKPLADLPAGAIKVTIERPPENFGTILHDSNAQGDPKNNGGDAQDSLSAKINQLAASDNLFGRTEPKPLPDTIELVNKGDGIYEGTFDQATVGGQYKLRFDLAWTDPRTDKIRRTETLDRSVPVLPTAEASITQTQISGGTATIVITPKDKFGNFVGPGYGPMFGVTVTGGGTPVLPLVDATNRGLYTLQITGIPAGADPQVKITYGDDTIRDSVLSKTDSGGGSQPPECTGWECIPWWIWILIIIIIVIIIIFRRRNTP